MKSKLKQEKNHFINEAFSLYNLFNRRRLLKKQLAKESGLTRADSLIVLYEFEKLLD